MDWPAGSAAEQTARVKTGQHSNNVEVEEVGQEQKHRVAYTVHYQILLIDMISEPACVSTKPV